MRKEYDFKDALKNPYLKKKITIDIDEYVLDYFKNETINTNVSYKTLMELVLKDFVDNKKDLNIYNSKI